MGIIFTILMGIPFTITMGFLFTIVLGIQLTISNPLVIDAPALTSKQHMNP